MVHLQAPDYSVPWADEEFLAEFGPIEKRKCYEIMHGRKNPCEICPTFKAFKTQKTVISEWHCQNGKIYMTVVEPLPYELPLLIEFAVECKPSIRISGPHTVIKLKKKKREPVST